MLPARSPAVARLHRRQYLRDGHRPNRSGDPGGRAQAAQHEPADNLSSHLGQARILFLPESSRRSLRTHHFSSGFATQRKTNLTVDTDSALRVDAALAVGTQSEDVIVTSSSRGTGGDRRHPSRRGRVQRADDLAPVERKELHGSSGDPTGSGAYLDAVAQLRHHGRRHRKPRSVGRSESRQPIHQWPARIVQRLHGQRHRCAGAHEWRHLHHSEPRFDRRVPGTDQQLRSRVRQLQRRHGHRRQQDREATPFTATPSSSFATPRWMQEDTSIRPGRRSSRTSLAARLAARCGATRSSSSPITRERERPKVFPPATSPCRPSPSGTATSTTLPAQSAALISHLCSRRSWAIRSHQESPTPAYFPAAIIPQSAWSAPGKNLLQYIPSPNVSASQYSTSAFAQTVRDDKGSVRIDANSRLGQISGLLLRRRLSISTIPIQARSRGRASPASTHCLSGARNCCR